MPDLVLLAHDDSWASRYQVSSLAAAAAASGREVALCLFFGALAAWAGGRWDAVDPASPVSQERLESLAFPPLTSLLAGGRAEGRIRCYACSASVRFLELDAGAVQASVDAILGWQTFSRMVLEAERTVTF